MTRSVPVDDAFMRRLVAGDRRAVARAITVVEAGGDAADDLLSRLPAGDGSGWRIGVTGPPGAGKSTLTSVLAGHYAGAGRKVAVVAVDPSSPFTCGAVLGDRIRMGDLTRTPNVLVRSMATRGATGGLGRRTGEAVQVLESGGFDLVIIESVGIGQQDIDIRTLADTTVALLVPESGDHIQMMKAGLMEAADVYVVNKSDRAGGGSMVAAVQVALTGQHRLDRDWSPTALGISATEGTGLDELLAELDRHWRHLASATRRAERHRRRVEASLRRTATDIASAALWRRITADRFESLVADVLARRTSLRAAAHALADETGST